MSQHKQMRRTGIHQEDLVEMLYYIKEHQISMMSYLSTLDYLVSKVFGEMSDMTSALSLSMSGKLGNPAGDQSFGISTRVSFPGSITDFTNITITLV